MSILLYLAVVIEKLPGNKKIVVVNQHTDFTKESIKKDFPNGSDRVWKAEVSRYLSDIQVVNQVGRKLLEDWKDIKEETKEEVIENKPNLKVEQESGTALENQSNTDNDELNQMAQKLIDFLSHNDVKVSKSDDSKLMFIDKNKHEFTLDEVIKAFTQAQLKAIEEAEAKLSTDQFIN